MGRQNRGTAARSGCGILLRFFPVPGEFVSFPLIMTKASIANKGGGLERRAKTNDDIDGFVKVLSEKDTDKILGVHVRFFHNSPPSCQLIGIFYVDYGT